MKRIIEAVQDWGYKAMVMAFFGLIVVLSWLKLVDFGHPDPYDDWGGR